jgi:hypothetical protein
MINIEIYNIKVVINGQLEDCCISHVRYNGSKTHKEQVLRYIMMWRVH